MAGPAGGRGSGDGIDGAVLEAGVGSAGAVLAASAAEAGGSDPDVGHAAPAPSQFQPRAAGAKERLRRRRADAQTAAGARTDGDLRTRCRSPAVDQCATAQ